MKGGFIEEHESFFVFADGTPITPEQLRKTLRRVLDNLNLDSSLYDFHSLRVGRATDMQLMGYDLEFIKSAGRWKSNAVY